MAKTDLLNFLKDINFMYNDCGMHDCVSKMLDDFEEEIRAKVIDEFAKEIEAEYDNDACPNVTDYLDYKISLRDLFKIAEQLKEE